MKPVRAPISSRLAIWNSGHQVTLSWTHRRERGSRTLLQGMAWLSLRFGWRAGRVLLVPITAYFYAFSRRSRAASRCYLARALNREPRQRDVFRHFLTFASILLDRLFFLTRNLAGYDIELIGAEHLAKWRAQGKGCILLGSHLGSFEVLRALAETEPHMKVRALMLEMPGATAELCNALNPRVAEKVIPIGSLSSMLQVKESLEAGEMVGILADRIARGDKIIRVPFFGELASFPAGPFILSSVLRVPVVLCYGFYCGDRRYQIRFEPFADHVELPRGRRNQELEAWVRKFAERLEEHCRRRPFNWFNFYDFWDREAS